MDKPTFARCLSPLLGYYGKALSDDSLDMYFRELGGYTEKQLEDAVRGHIANSKFFPKIPDLRKRITGEEEVVTRRTTYHERPEYGRHREAAERMFDALREGHTYEPEGTFRYPIRPLAEAALDCYRRWTHEVSEYVARSRAYAEINLLTIEKFG